MNNLRLIDVFSDGDDCITECAETYGLKCCWGSKSYMLGKTKKDTFSILREINIDNFIVVLSVQAIAWDDEINTYNVDILTDDKTDSMISINKERVIFEVNNYIEVITSDMHKGFNYLYNNILVALLNLIGYVDNDNYYKGVNLASVPDYTF